MKKLKCWKKENSAQTNVSGLWKNKKGQWIKVSQENYMPWMDMKEPQKNKDFEFRVGTFNPSGNAYVNAHNNINKYHISKEKAISLAKSYMKSHNKC